VDNRSQDVEGHRTPHPSGWIRHSDPMKRQPPESRWRRECRQQSGIPRIYPWGGCQLVVQENLQYVLRLALDVHWFVVAGEGITWHRSVELPVRYLPKTRTLPEGKGMLVALILETGHRPTAKR